MGATPSAAKTSSSVFPKAEIDRRLRTAITRLGVETSGMREPWEPAFDSMAVVGVVLVVEAVLPELKIAPEKVVRKGGYGSVDDAVRDITDRLQGQWERQRR
jgi:hypothetical protein